MSRETVAVEDWHEARRTGIGGSDAAAVLGVSEFDEGPLDIYLQKIGAVPPKEDTPPMQRGRALEPIIAGIYTEQTGRKVRRQPMLRLKDQPWVIANIDRQIIRSGGEGETSILEIKAPGLQSFQRVRMYGLTDDYIIQVQHYLAVLGYENADIILHNAERWQPLIFTVQRDDELIEQILEAEERFWKDHVLPKVPPEEGERSEVELPEYAGEIVSWDGTPYEDWLRDLYEARQLYDEGKELYDQAKDVVGNKMVELEVDVVEGAGHRVYYREQAGRRSLNKKRLQADYPEIDLEDYYDQGKPFRSFRPYFNIVNEE